MDPTASGVIEALQTGGNVALYVSVYFIWKASERLARIEKALDKFIATQETK